MRISKVGSHPDVGHKFDENRLDRFNDGSVVHVSATIMWQTVDSAIGLISFNGMLEGFFKFCDFLWELIFICIRFIVGIEKFVTNSKLISVISQKVFNDDQTLNQKWPIDFQASLTPPPRWFPNVAGRIWFSATSLCTRKSKIDPNSSGMSTPPPRTNPSGHTPVRSTPKSAMNA